MSTHPRPAARIPPSPPRAAGVRPLLDPGLLRRLLRARDRIDAASHEAWPVRRLAGLSGVSQAHFARRFKQAFGIPPHRYLLSRRIEQALTLLRDTDLSITDIALATGWSSQGSFGRIFRDITGHSPGESRRLQRGVQAGLGSIPACVLKAALRPELDIAVLEKRRRAPKATVPPSPQEGTRCVKESA